MPSVRRAAKEARLARAETALGRSFFPSFARRSISSKIRESRTYAPVLIRFEMISAGFPDRVGRSELLRLRDVGDVGSERLPVLEVRLDALPTIADDEDEVPHAVLGEGLDDVLQEGAVPHGDHDLGDRGGEGTHPGALSRGEDDGLHVRCTCR